MKGKKPSSILQSCRVKKITIGNRGCTTIISQIFLYFPIQIFLYFPIQMIWIGKKPASILQTYSVTNFIIRNVGNIRGCERGVCSPYTNIPLISCSNIPLLSYSNDLDWQETRINPANLQCDKLHNQERRKYQGL